MPETNEGLEKFLSGKTVEAIALFWHFVNSFKKIGNVEIHPKKSMVAIGMAKPKAFVIRLGKTSVDVVFAFDQPYSDNLCFSKIAQVPNTNQYNHHLRIMNKDDVNDEVKKFMKMSLEKKIVNRST